MISLYFCLVCLSLCLSFCLFVYLFVHLHLLKRLITISVLSLIVCLSSLNLSLCLCLIVSPSLTYFGSKLAYQTVFYNCIHNCDLGQHLTFQCRIIFEDCGTVAACIIDSKNRKSCKRCRFEKCLVAGMKPNWVSVESEGFV